MIKDSCLTGLRTILPIVLFIIILGWVFGTLFDWIECIELLFPDSMLKAIGLPDVVIKLLGLLLICIIIWIIGIISKQPHMSKKIKSWLEPLIQRVPLLNHLFKITNQVQDTDSFKKVVMIIHGDGMYELGFLTGEVPKELCDAVKEPRLLSVAVPFPPFTSYYFKIFRPDRIAETEFPVAKAIAYMFSMGLAEATKKIMEESHL